LTIACELETPSSKIQEIVQSAVMPDKKKNFKNQFGKRKYPAIRSQINFAALGEVAVDYGKYIKLLEAQDRIGTLENYVRSLMSLLAFKIQLRFQDITVAKLINEGKGFPQRKEMATAEAAK
jgi:hypothetical protein